MENLHSLSPRTPAPTLTPNFDPPTTELTTLRHGDIAGSQELYKLLHAMLLDIRVHVELDYEHVQCQTGIYPLYKSTRVLFKGS